MAMALYVGIATFLQPQLTLFELIAPLPPCLPSVQSLPSPHCIPPLRTQLATKVSSLLRSRIGIILILIAQLSHDRVAYPLGELLPFSSLSSFSRLPVSLHPPPEV
jgi:hypothetical protein